MLLPPSRGLESSSGSSAISQALGTKRTVKKGEKDAPTLTDLGSELTHIHASSIPLAETGIEPLLKQGTRNYSLAVHPQPFPVSPTVG